MARRGKSARSKGLAAEREFFSLLNTHLPPELWLERDLAQPRDGGLDGSIGSFNIEVKRQERLALPQWLAQARAQPGIPVVCYRQNRQPWRCLVELTPRQLAAVMLACNSLPEFFTRPE